MGVWFDETGHEGSPLEINDPYLWTRGRPHLIRVPELLDSAILDPHGLDDERLDLLAPVCRELLEDAQELGLGFEDVLEALHRSNNSKQA